MDGSTELERCYRRQHDRLWRSLLLFTADPDIASDALAEAFAQMLRWADAIRDLDRWVWKAAFAIARGELQHRSRSAPLVDLPQEMPASTIDLLRALDRLSPKQRASIVLHHYADGEWLAFTHTDDASGPQIWAVRPDGSDAAPLTSLPGFIEGTQIYGITRDPSWGRLGR